MRAKIREPGESLRWFFYGLAAICIGAAAIFRIEIGPPLDPVFFIGAALLLMSPIFERRAAWRSVEIDARPGNLQISGRGLFGKKENVIALTNVTGASTARVGDDVSLALALGSRSRHPVLFRFENDADAKIVLGALGVGRNGFGILVWDRGPRFIHLFAAIARVATTLFCLVVFIMALVSDSFAATLDAQSLSTLIVVGVAAFVTLMPLAISKRSLSLLPSGIHTFEERARAFAYADIVSIIEKNSRFVIVYRRHRVPFDEGQVSTTSMPYVKRSAFLPGLDEIDTAMIVQQVTSAATLAHAKTGRPEHYEQVRTLVEHKDGETSEAWIRRLDAQADSWRASPPRHGESLPYRHALWQAVEDHDCDDLVRVLAARMLAKLDPEEAPPKLRVIAEAIRDPHQASQIRIALDPEVEPMAKSIAHKSKR